MENLQSESMVRLFDMGRALRLYFEALEREGLLPLLEQQRNDVTNALFELTVTANHERFKRSGPNRRPATFNPTFPPKGL